MATDSNGFKIMPAHRGVEGPPLGPCVYVLKRCDGKVLGAWKSRHDAVAARTIHARNWLDTDWLEVEYVPVGSLRIEDMDLINTKENPCP